MNSSALESRDHGLEITTLHMPTSNRDLHDYLQIKRAIKSKMGLMDHRRGILNSYRTRLMCKTRSTIPKIHVMIWRHVVAAKQCHLHGTTANARNILHAQNYKTHQPRSKQPLRRCPHWPCSLPVIKSYRHGPIHTMPTCAWQARNTSSRGSFEFVTRKRARETISTRWDGLASYRQARELVTCRVVSVAVTG